MRARKRKTKDPRQGELLATLPGPELPAVPDYIPAEVFLENLGYFTPSSKRIKGVYTKEKILGERLNPDGTTRIIKTKISANHELGLPITSDHDYYRAFQKICDELVDRSGRFQLPMTVATARLLRYAGKQENSRCWKEAKDWLRRMTFTGIEGGVYRAKQKDFQEGFAGTVFSQVVIKGEAMKNGKIAETNYVWPSPWFLSNYFYRHLRPIDFNFHHRLRKPIAKALYPLLETGWYASGGHPYTKSYEDLCNEFLLKEFQHLSRIKQQLDPAHRELQREQFLAKWEYQPAVEKDGWIITYWPGGKFLHDQKARQARRQLADQINQNSERSRSPKSTELSNDEQNLLDEILRVCGDIENRAAYLKVIQKHHDGILWTAISETREAAHEGKIKRTKGAFFMDAVKQIAKLRSKGFAALKGAELAQ